MARTEIRGGQIKDTSVQRSDLDTTTTTEAVVRKIVAGTNVTLGSTGVDAGTGDVTINAPNLVKTNASNTAQYVSTRYTLTDAAPVAVDWNNGNTQFVTLGASRTFTFANPLTGGRYLLEIKQDGTGSRVPTLPSEVKWSGGTTPTFTTTAGRTDIVTLYYNGTNYAGSVSLNHNM